MGIRRKSVEVALGLACSLLLHPRASGAEVHLAAKKGDLTAIRRILDADPNQVNATDEDMGGTPLHYAAAFGHEEVVKLLISKGAKVNAHANNQTTPLQVAAEQGFSGITQLLIAAGAEVDAKGVGDSTALHQAAQQGHKDIVNLLISKGADVRAKTSSRQWTPLHFAAAFGRTSVVEALLAAGAPVDAKDKDGLTPLVYAKAEKDAKTVSLLLKRGADPDTKPPQTQLSHYESEGMSFDLPQYMVVPEKNRLDAKKLDAYYKTIGQTIVLLRWLPDGSLILQIAKSRATFSFESLLAAKKALEQRVKAGPLELLGEQFTKFTVETTVLAGQKALLEYGEKANGEVGVMYRFLHQGHCYLMAFIHDSKKSFEKNAPLREIITRSLKLTMEK